MNPHPYMLEQLARQKIAEARQAADKERLISTARGGAVRGGPSRIAAMLMALIIGLRIR